jgi:single-strand DNA-binding protein
MASLNRVELIGNLGADPEARSTSNGKEVVNLRLACSESWKDRDGNRQERTEWIPVVIWNEAIGKVAKQYLRKGSRCYISGQFQTRKWTDQSGADRYSTEVVVQPFHGELVLLDPPQRQETGGHLASRPQPAFDADLDDDVPF